MTDASISFYTDRITEMAVCSCGAVFTASGTHKDVQSLYTGWASEHEHCTGHDPSERRVFWLSFCDSTRPRGDQFLGACVIEVTAADADAQMFDLLLQFPLAREGAEWIAAAIAKAGELGCNPGGEVASLEMPVDHPRLGRYKFGVLMDRATVERIDKGRE